MMPSGAPTGEERSFWTSAQEWFTRSFNSVIDDYDALRPHIDRLALQNAAYSGAFTEGATAMIMNRVNGAYALYRSPTAFFNAGVSGFRWANYFSRSPSLRMDVHDSGMAAFYSHLTFSFRGIATAVVTGVNVSRRVNEIENQVAIRYQQQRNQLLFSAGLSIGVTQIFRRAGAVVQTDIQRMMVRSAMRTWQMTGVVGICYGLSRLNQTMEETGVFGATLRQRRDAFGDAGNEQHKFEENRARIEQDLPALLPPF
jgi:hypothetical protein